MIHPKTEEKQMKKMTLLVTALIGLSAVANAEVSLAPVKHLYIPTGFDNNDSVEVVVSGTFPTPCYSRNTVAVDLLGDTISIEISAIQRDANKALCPDMLVPYKEVVALGNLQGGSYEVVVNNKLKETLLISESSSNAIDDHLYAAIDQLEKVSENEYVLHGWRYSHCVQLDKVEVISNGTDTLSVLPVMKQLSRHCPMKGMPVSYPVSLDFSKLKTREPLVHVRTMDGKSFNNILNLESF